MLFIPAFPLAVFSGQTNQRCNGITRAIFYGLTIQLGFHHRHALRELGPGGAQHSVPRGTKAGGHTVQERSTLLLREAAMRMVELQLWKIRYLQEVRKTDPVEADCGEGRSSATRSRVCMIFSYSDAARVARDLPHTLPRVRAELSDLRGPTDRANMRSALAEWGEGEWEGNDSIGGTLARGA